VSSAPPTPVRVQILAAEGEASESYFVAPEKLISGNPKETAWVQHASPDQHFSAGLWRSEVGKWNIRYTEDECCRFDDARQVEHVGHRGGQLGRGAGFHNDVSRHWSRCLFWLLVP
jgi:hypothetical protein